MDRPPSDDERAATNLVAAEADVEPLADRRADDGAVERVPCPREHPTERTLVGIAMV